MLMASLVGSPAYQYRQKDFPANVDVEVSIIGVCN